MNDNTHQKDIVIIDDNPDNLRMLKDILKQESYRVRPAISGATALEGIQAVMPDLILLDIKMPEMDGFEVCRRLNTAGKFLLYLLALWKKPVKRLRPLKWVEWIISPNLSPVKKCWSGSGHTLN